MSRLINTPPIGDHRQDTGSSGSIVIYSYGKSGTSSIFKSLGQQTERPIVRFHLLDRARVCAKIARRESQGLKLGRSLRNSRRYSRNLPLLTGTQIITMVRDPVAAAVSSFFYGLGKQDRGGLLGTAIESLDPEPLLRSFVVDFTAIEDRYLSWFDREIDATLGFNLFRRDFDRSRGYQRYRSQGFDLLVAKLECADQILEDAIGRFLSLDDFSLTRHNTAREKPYSELYEVFRERLALPLDLLQQIYAHHSIRHFYRDSEIKRFIERWRVG